MPDQSPDTSGTRRNILLITTDQQRYDSLGCNGGTIARTPVADRLAAEGVNYRRAYNQNTVCMPARSTILTGQYVRTHGVVANGIALPPDAPSIAAFLAERAGYRTALLGKAHFEPGVDPQRRFEENARAARGDTGPWRGFERSIQAMHIAAWGDLPVAHYGRWLAEHHPEHLHSFANLLQAEPGGDTDAPETKNNPIPRPLHHTDWVADLTVDWLASIGDDEPWFCWMSFPDPHHPWDPPASENDRVPGRTWTCLRVTPERTTTSAPSSPASRRTGWPSGRDAVADPVGQVDLAPTLCAIAGIEPAEWMQGAALPLGDEQPGRERMLCEWDSQFPGYGMHLRSVYRDGWLCTVYEPSTAGKPNGLEEVWGPSVLEPSSVVYEADRLGPGGISIATGELYDVAADPLQWQDRKSVV